MPSDLLHLETRASRYALLFSVYSGFIHPKFISIQFLSPTVYWDYSSYCLHWPTSHQKLGWFSLLQLVLNWKKSFLLLKNSSHSKILWHCFLLIFLFLFYWLLLPIGDSGVKNKPANVGDEGLIPGSGKSPGERNGNPFQFSYLGNPTDRGAWWATGHGIPKESDTTWQLNNDNLPIT